MLLFVYTTTRKRFVIFTWRYFKLSWNTTALNQSNCRNFSCSGINSLIFEWSGKLIFPFFRVKRAKERANAGAKAQERIRRWCYQANDATAYLWLVEHDLPPTHPRHTYSKNVFRSFLQPRPQCLHIWVFAERELQGLKLHWSRKFLLQFNSTVDVRKLPVLLERSKKEIREKICKRSIISFKK